MGSQELKREQVFSVRDAAVFLRAVADGLESAAAESLADYDLSLEDFKKLKIEIKNLAENVSVKVKVKYSEQAAALAEASTESVEGKSKKPKYSTLKKRMDKTIEALCETAKTGNFPKKNLIESFLADSEQMLTYPGYGDEFYEEYGKACTALKDAFEGGDIDLFQEKCVDIKVRKKECHDRYK